MVRFRLRVLWRVVLALTLLLMQASPALAYGQPLPQEGAVRASRPDAASEAIYQAPCPAPRPPVKIETQALGDGKIQATVTAGFGPLTLIRFGAMQNSHIELPGASQQYGSNAEIKPPAN